VIRGDKRKRGKKISKGVKEIKTKRGGKKKKKRE